MTIYVAAGSSAQSYHGVQAMNYGRFPLNAIAATNGSPNIVGTGTTFTTQIEPGYQLNGFPSVNVYVVSSITDDTHLTLTSNVTDPTASYSCSPDFRVPNDAFTRVPMRGPNVWDTDHFHFTDHAALTGTVTKSTSSTTIVGSGTSFLSQLSVNQVVDIPGGGGTDTVVVKTITDNTHFTVWVNPAFSAAAQTATKNPDCLAIPAGITNGATGHFMAYLYQNWDFNATGMREISLYKNLPSGITPGLSNVANEIQGEFLPPVTVTGDETASMCPLPFTATDGDFLAAYVYQNSGGSLSMTPDFPNGVGGYAYGMGIQFLGV